jgi:inactivated superfamily I helicase
VPVYLAKSREGFLEAVSQLARSFDMSSLVILAPSVTSANCIRRQIAADLKDRSFLPKIFPLQEISVSGESVIAADKSRFVGYFANQLLIANLLRSREGQNFSTIQSIDMSKAILVLLHEFMKSGKEPKALEDLHLEHALHLGKLSEFLQSVKDAWLEALCSSKLQDVTGAFLENCSKLTVLLKESRLKNRLLFVGGIEELSVPLIEAMLESDVDIVLLPSAAQDNISYGEGIIDMAREREVTFHELVPAKKLGNAVEHYLLANDIREMDFIFRLSTSEHALGKHVLVVTEDLKFVRSLVTLYSYWNIKVKNCLGLELNAAPASRFLLLIAGLLNPAAQLKDLVILLKHPYFKDLDKIEYLAIDLSTAPLFEVKDFALKHCASIWQALEPFLAMLNFSKVSFTEVLLAHLTAAEQLRPAIWNDLGSICEYIREMLQASNFLGEIDPSDYREIFGRLMLGRYSQSDEPSARLSIVPPEEAVFFKADTVLVPQFHDSNWPKTGDSDIWISDGIRASLGLTNVIERQIASQRSYFEQILTFPKVIFTRAKRAADKESTESRFWPESKCFTNVEVKRVTS